MTTAKRRFGQNFLVDRSVVDRIVAAVAPRSDETIVEVGSGQGALTARLLETTGRVVAIEFDRELVPFLRTKFARVANLHLIEADALATDFCAAIAPAPRTRVVANLPYNIATAILQRLIEQRECMLSFGPGRSLLQGRKIVRCAAAGVSAGAESLEHSRSSASPSKDWGGSEERSVIVANCQRGFCATPQDDPQQPARRARVHSRVTSETRRRQHRPVRCGHSAASSSRDSRAGRVGVAGECDRMK